MSLNPSDRAEKPADDSVERSVYTPAQVRSFLAAVACDRLRALWHLVVVTGLRRGELAGLQWQDLALDTPPATLTVRVTRAMAGTRVVEQDPKTRAGRRRIILDAETASLLAAHREAMAGEARLRGEPLGPWVFVDEWGAPLNPNWLVRRLHIIQARHELPAITLYDLRHTAATMV